MENTGENLEETPRVETTSLKHQMGRMVVGAFAGFTAEQLAGKAYDWALRAYRARKSA